MFDTFMMQFPAGAVRGLDISCSTRGNEREVTVTLHLKDLPDGKSTTDLGDNLSIRSDWRSKDVSGIVAELAQEDDDKKHPGACSSTMDRGETQTRWQATLDQLRSCNQVPEVKMYNLPKYQHGNTNPEPGNDLREGQDTNKEQEGCHVLAFMQRAHRRGKFCQKISPCLLGDPVGYALNAEPCVSQGLPLELACRQQSDRAANISDVLDQNRAFSELLEMECVYLDCSTGEENRFNARLDTGATHSIIRKDRVLGKSAQFRSLPRPEEISTASGEILTVREYVELDWKSLCPFPGKNIRSIFLVVEGSKTLGDYNAVIGARDSVRTGHIDIIHCDNHRIHSPVGSGAVERPRRLTPAGGCPYL